MTDFRESLKSLCDIGVLDSKPKKGMTNRYKVKYSKDEIDLIYTDDTLFKML
jgi:hypothetical protein